MLKNPQPKYALLTINTTSSDEKAIVLLHTFPKLRSFDK